MESKLNLTNQTSWNHHRSGWKFALNCLRHAHNENGIYFDGWLDGNEIPVKPFVGFFHCTPEHPKTAEPKYKIIRSLSESLKTPNWKNVRQQCRGLFTVSDYLAEFLRENTNVPVCSLIHPTEFPDLVFNFDDFQNHKAKVIVIGHWMRKFESIYDLKTTYEKCILKAGHSSQQIDIDHLKKTKTNQDVMFIDHLNNEEYDLALSRNIVFLDLHDVAANNTIIDCIARNTPCLVNQLPGAEDYLGKNYPFYFSCLEEAESKLKDTALIKATTEYLKNLPIKQKMTSDFFLKSMTESEIYQNIHMWRKSGVIKFA